MCQEGGKMFKTRNSLIQYFGNSVIQYTVCWGEGPKAPPPPKISRTTQRSDKRQTALESSQRELTKACIVFENRGHGSGQAEVKGQKSGFCLGAIDSGLSQILASFALNSLWLHRQRCRETPSPVKCTGQVKVRSPEVTIST